MTSFNTTVRVPELSEKKSTRRTTENDLERLNIMRRIEAFTELKDLGFTPDEIKFQLNDE